MKTYKLTPDTKSMLIKLLLEERQRLTELINNFDNVIKYYEKEQLIDSHKYYKYTCPICDKEFSTTAKEQKYCSSNCEFESKL